MRKETACDSSRSETDLPALLYLPDLARFFGRSEKSIRAMVARKQFPAPFKFGGRLAWRRENVLEFVSEIHARETKPTVQINLAAYKYDPNRFQVMFTIPATETETRKRKSMVAPAGLDRAAAEKWAKAQSATVFRDLLGVEKKEEAPAAIITTKKKSSVQTLAEFWTRFEGEYLSNQKPNTIRGYRCHWSKYIRPALGDFPLDMIGRMEIAKLRESLGHLDPRSRNQVLNRVRSALKQAEIWGLIEHVPTIKPEREPKKPDPIAYSEKQADDLIAAAREAGYDALILIMLHGGLRVSEVCALQWDDIDFAGEIITISRNLSDNVETTPKGVVSAPIGMSEDLITSLKEISRRGKYVFMRNPESREDFGKWTRHNPQSIRRILNDLQIKAGLEPSGPHRLRHTCLTLLASKGLDPWKLQRAARHAKISTTQRYVHLAAEQAVKDAAALWAKPSQKSQKAPRKGLKLAS